MKYIFYEQIDLKVYVNNLIENYFIINFHINISCSIIYNILSNLFIHNNIIYFITYN